MKSKLAALFFLYSLLFFAQDEKQYKIRTIAFYNVENLFDIENDTLIFDDDRTPDGKDSWTKERYGAKIENIAKVLSEVGADVTKASPDLIGLCEVENHGVIEDLTNNTLLARNDYGIVHFDSPDERGIDVALLYKKDVFLPNSFSSHRLLLVNDDGERDYTRDQLVVGGMLDDEPFHIIVNHWPSRSGGEARSKPNRIKAAELNRRIIDSLKRIDPLQKIVSMGDFNDGPKDDSFKKVLKTKGMINRTAVNELFNPMEKLHRQGMGSLAYRDKWSLFDQIYFTGNLLNAESGYRFWKAGIFSPKYLVTKKGRYKGYPFRTYAGGSYTGGFSDHFPVYVYLIKKVKK